MTETTGTSKPTKDPEPRGNERLSAETSPAPRSVAVVSAGLSQPSSTRLLAGQLADAAVRALAADRERAEVVVIELRDLAHDVVNGLLTGFAGAQLQKAIDSVIGADALIAVTPIFTASYSGLFKSFFDVLEVGALAGMPTLLGATGGTARHSLALEHAIRPLFSYLRADTVPTSVYAASADWGPGTGENQALSQRIGRAGAELARAIERSDRPARRDIYAEPVPFEQLLTG
jgi:FMN reductase